MKMSKHTFHKGQIVKLVVDCPCKKCNYKAGTLLIVIEVGKDFLQTSPGALGNEFASTYHMDYYKPAKTNLTSLLYRQVFASYLENQIAPITTRYQNALTGHN